MNKVHVEIKKVVLTSSILVVLLLSFGANVKAEPASEESIYIEDVLYLEKVIEIQQNYLRERQDQLEDMEENGVDPERLSDMNTRLSDLSTRVITAEGQLTSVNPTNYYELLTAIHTDLVEINAELTKNNTEDSIELKMIIAEDYLTAYTEVVGRAIEMFENEDFLFYFEEEDSESLIESLDSMDELINDLGDDLESEDLWTELEEELTDFQKDLQDLIKSLDE